MINLFEKFGRLHFEHIVTILLKLTHHLAQHQKRHHSRHFDPGMPACGHHNVACIREYFSLTTFRPPISPSRNILSYLKVWSIADSLSCEKGSDTGGALMVLLAISIKKHQTPKTPHPSQSFPDKKTSPYKRCNLNK